MTRRNQTLRAAIAASILSGYLAASAPPTDAARVFAPQGAGLAAPNAASNAPSTADAPTHRPSTRVALPDFDARRDPSTGEINSLGLLKTARHDTSAALAALRSELPGDLDSLHVDIHASGPAKQVVSYDGMLTRPSSGTPDRIAREFLEHNAALFGLASDDASALMMRMENVDEQSGVTFLKYEQTVHGITVFGSEMSLAISAAGEVVTATSGHLIRDGAAPADPVLSQQEAIVRAFGHCGAEISPAQLGASKTTSEVGLAKYANPLGAGREDVMVGPSIVDVAGEARSAFHVYVDKGSSEWYETLVDATSGELIYRGSLGAHSQGTVFTEHPDAGPRTLEPFGVDTAKFPNTPAGDIWLDGRVTTGNNVDAYRDRDGNNLPDPITSATVSNGRALADANGTFTFAFTLGRNPLRYNGAPVTNLFYFNNVMHDWMYTLGFTETARNFQLDNYARGGAQNDSVNAEAQDGSGTNNANFLTPPDGTAPRMQMFIFTMATSATADDRDSCYDGDVVFHEYGHGVSRRLVGNGSGLDGTQSKAMGEGWSDYWAVTAFDDPIVGEFVTRNPTVGIRRTPYDGRTSAPNGTYAMIGIGGFEVHNDGEIWCQTLVDLRRQLGASRTDRLVLAGMKVTPVGPSMLNARDGIIAANRAMFGGADECMIWTVFARHGMGVSATGNDGTVHNAGFGRPVVCGPIVR